MNKKLIRFLSFLLCFCFLFEQVGFAQVAGQLDISGHIAQLRTTLMAEKFRPLHLRYLSYDNQLNNFNILLDKGDQKNLGESHIEDTTRNLLNYFFVGISLPNESFWVNLRPDSQDQIIDPEVEKTDVGRILLEADLQLKKDTAGFTSPRTPEGKEYWQKLYEKAGRLFGSEAITIPTITRPWIVPDEVIIRETDTNGYIYKATLKVMLEQDYLKSSSAYNFKDDRLKALNEYASELIRETIIPKLTKDINTAKRYAPLRQVYYSLILAQWFKARFYGKGGLYSYLIDKKNLTGLTSKTPWSKAAYFNGYKKSFQDGEYRIQEPTYTAYGQTIRTYMSGGLSFAACSPIALGSISLAAGESRSGAIQGINFTLIGGHTRSPMIRNAHTTPVMDITGGSVSNPFDVKVMSFEAPPVPEEKFISAGSPLQKTALRAKKGTIGQYRDAQTGGFGKMIGALLLSAGILLAPALLSNSFLPNIGAARKQAETITQKALSAGARPTALPSLQQLSPALEKRRISVAAYVKTKLPSGAMRVYTDTIRRAEQYLNIAGVTPQDLAIMTAIEYEGSVAIAPKPQAKGKAREIAPEKIVSPRGAVGPTQFTRIGFKDLMQFVEKHEREGVTPQDKARFEFCKPYQKYLALYRANKKDFRKTVAQLKSLDAYFEIGAAIYCKNLLAVNYIEKNAKKAERFPVRVYGNAIYNAGIHNVLKAVRGDSGLLNGLPEETKRYIRLHEAVRDQIGGAQETPGYRESSKSAGSPASASSTINGSPPLRGQGAPITQQELSQVYWHDIEPVADELIRDSRPLYSDVQEEKITVAQRNLRLKTIIARAIERIAAQLVEVARTSNEKSEVEKMKKELVVSTLFQDPQQLDFAIAMAAFVGEQMVENGNGDYTNVYFPRDGALFFISEKTIGILNGQKRDPILYHISRATFKDYYNWMSGKVSKIAKENLTFIESVDALKKEIEDNKDQRFQAQIQKILQDLKALGIAELEKVRFVDTGFKTFPMMFCALMKMANGNSDIERLVQVSHLPPNILPQLDTQKWRRSVRSWIGKIKAFLYAKPSIAYSEDAEFFLQHPFEAHHDGSMRMLSPALQLRAYWIQMLFVLGAIQYHDKLHDMATELVKDGKTPQEAKQIASDIIKKIYQSRSMGGLHAKDIISNIESAYNGQLHEDYSDLNNLLDTLLKSKEITRDTLSKNNEYRALYESFIKKLSSDLATIYKIPQPTAKSFLDTPLEFSFSPFSIHKSNIKNIDGLMKDGQFEKKIMEYLKEKEKAKGFDWLKGIETLVTINPPHLNQLIIKNIEQRIDFKKIIIDLKTFDVKEKIKKWLKIGAILLLFLNIKGDSVNTPIPPEVARPDKIIELIDSQGEKQQEQRAAFGPDGAKDQQEKQSIKVKKNDYLEKIIIKLAQQRGVGLTNTEIANLVKKVEKDNQGLIKNSNLILPNWEIIVQSVEDYLEEKSKNKAGSSPLGPQPDKEQHGNSPLLPIASSLALLAGAGSSLQGSKPASSALKKQGLISSFLQRVKYWMIFSEKDKKEALKKEIIDTLSIERLDELRKTIQDENLLLLVYRKIVMRANERKVYATAKDHDKELYEIQRARAIMEEDSVKIAQLKARVDPEKILYHHGVKDTEKAVKERIWKMLAYASMIDLRYPSRGISEEAVADKISQLRKHPYMIRTVDKMAAGHLETLTQQSAELKKSNVGVVDEETFVRAPEFYGLLQKVFKKVLDAAAIDRRVFALVLFDNSANSAFVNMAVVDRVFFEIGFLKEEFQKGNLTEDRIAAIFSHELAHLISRLKKIARTARDPDFGNRSWENLSLRQEEEEYADLLALAIVDKAGYNVHALSRFFQQFADGEGGNRFCYSHPTALSRYQEQSRYILNAPYKNKNIDETTFAQDAQESIAGFEGSFAGLEQYHPPESQDTELNSIIQNAAWLSAEINTHAKEANYTAAELKEHLLEAKKLLEKFTQWLSKDISSSQWHSVFGFFDENGAGTPKPIESLVSIVADLSAHKPTSVSNGIGPLLEECLVLIRALEIESENIAARFNVADEWRSRFYFRVVRRNYQPYWGNAPLPQEYSRWAQRYKALLLQELESPEVFIKKAAEGKYIPELFLELFASESDLIVQQISLATYVDALRALIYKPGEEKRKLSREPAQNLVIALVNVLKKEAPQAIWEKAFKVLDALHAEDIAGILESHNRAYQKDNAFEKLRDCVMGSNAGRRLFLDWMLRNIGHSDFIQYSLARFTSQEQKGFVLKTVETFRGPGIAYLIRFLKLEKDSEFLEALFTATVNSQDENSRRKHKMSLFEQIFQYMRALDTEHSAAEFIRLFFGKGGYLSSEFLDEALGEITDAGDLVALKSYLLLHKEELFERWKDADWQAVQGYSNATGLKYEAILKQMRSEHQDVWDGYLMAAGIRQLELSMSVKIRRDSSIMRGFKSGIMLSDNTHGHRGDVWFSERNQSYFKVKDEFNKAFPFIFTDLEYEQIVSYIVENLPPSPYRDYALYMTFVHKKLGIALEDSFSRPKIKEALARLSDLQRLEAAKKILSHMTFDSAMARANRSTLLSSLSPYGEGGKTRFILTANEAQEYQRRADTFFDAYYYGDLGDNPDTQIDLFFLSLLQEAGLGMRLQEIIVDTSMDSAQKAKLIESFLARASGMRDEYLCILLDQILSGDAPIQDKITQSRNSVEMLSAEHIKNDYRLKILDIHTKLVSDGAGTREEKLQHVLKLITETYFPRRSPQRDDILDSFIERFVEYKDELLFVLPFYSSVYGSDGYAIEAGEGVRGQVTAKNIILEALDSMQSRVERLSMVLWLLGLGEKPEFLKKIELQYTLNFDHLKRSVAPQDLTHYLNIGKSSQRELLQDLLWDKQKGLFTGVNRKDWQAPPEWPQLLDSLFDAIFGSEYRNTIYEDVWNVFFEVAPKKSWLIAERVVINLLLTFAKLRQADKGSINKNTVLVHLLSAAGVEGIKLGQMLHSFGYLPDDFQKELEQLKYNVPMPFLKKDLLRVVNYRGLGGLRVLRKLGEASIKSVYEVVYRGAELAMKCKKPSVDYERIAGGAILKECFARLKQRLQLHPERLAYPLPEWMVDFIQQSIGSELDFTQELQNTTLLKSHLAGGFSLLEYVKLAWLLFRFNGGIKGVTEGMKGGRAPGLYSIDIPSSSQEDDAQDIIFDALIDGKPYSDTESKDANPDIAITFIKLIIKGFYHGDLHEGNIMRENGLKRVIWFLDTGSVGTLSYGELLNALGLFRALAQNDASKTKRFLRRVYDNLDAAELDEAVKGALLETSIIDKTLFLLRKINGTPKYNFLQFVKALTAASFILRHLRITSNKESAGETEQESASSEKIESSPQQPVAVAEDASVQSLIRMLRSSDYSSHARSQAADRLIAIAQGLSPTSNYSWENRAVGQQKELLDSIRTKELANLIIANTLPYSIRGKAFTLLVTLQEKGYLNAHGEKSHLENIVHDLQQQFIAENWIATSRDDVEKGDYLKGLLWIMARFYFPGRYQKDMFERKDMEQFKRFILDAELDFSARTYALEILLNRMHRRYEDLQVNDSITELLVFFSETEKNLSLELKILSLINEKSDERKEFFWAKGFVEYLRKRLADIFESRAESSALRQVLFALSMDLTYAVTGVDEKSIAAKREYIENTVWGGADALASRLSALKRFIQDDFLVSQGPYSKADGIVGTLEFTRKFLDTVERAQKNEEGYYPFLSQEHSQQIMRTIQIEGYLPLLLEIATADLSREKVYKNRQGEIMIAASWNIFCSLWRMASVQQDPGLLSLSQEHFNQLIDRAIASHAVYSEESDRKSSPSLDLIQTMVRSINATISYDFSHDTMYASGDLMRIRQNRLVVVQGLQKIIQTIFQEIRERRLVVEKSYYYSPDVLIIGSLVTYLRGQLYDFSQEAKAIMPDVASMKEIEQIIKDWCSLALDRELPIDARKQLFYGLLDLEDAGWFLQDRNGNFNLSRHPFFSQRQDLIYSFFDEVARVTGVIPEVMRFSDEQESGFYRALIKYVVERDRSLIKSDSGFAQPLEALLTRLQEEGQEHSDLGIFVKRQNEILSYFFENTPVLPLTATLGEYDGARFIKFADAQGNLPSESELVIRQNHFFDWVEYSPLLVNASPQKKIVLETLLQVFKRDSQAQICLFYYPYAGATAFRFPREGIIAVPHPFSNDPAVLFKAIAEEVTQENKEGKQLLVLDWNDDRIRVFDARVSEKPQIGELSVSQRTKDFIKQEGWQENWHENQGYLLQAFEQELFGETAQAAGSPAEASSSTSAPEEKQAKVQSAREQLNIAVEKVLKDDRFNPGSEATYRQVLEAGRNIFNAYAPYLNDDGEKVKTKFEELPREADELRQGLEETASFSRFKDLIRAIPRLTGNPDDLHLELFMRGLSDMSDDEVKVLGSLREQLDFRLTKGCSNQCLLCILAAPDGKFSHIPFPVAVNVLKRLKSVLQEAGEPLPQINPFFDSEPLDYYDKTIGASIADFMRIAQEELGYRVLFITHGSNLKREEGARESQGDELKSMTVKEPVLSLHPYHKNVLDYAKSKVDATKSPKDLREEREALIKEYVDKFEKLLSAREDFELNIYSQKKGMEILKKYLKGPLRHALWKIIEMELIKNDIYKTLSDKGVLKGRKRSKQEFLWSGRAALLLQELGVPDDVIRRIQEVQSVPSDLFSVLIGADGVANLILNENKNSRFRALGEIFKDSRSPEFRKFVKILRAISENQDRAEFKVVVEDADMKNSAWPEVERYFVDKHIVPYQKIQAEDPTIKILIDYNYVRYVDGLLKLYFPQGIAQGSDEKLYQAMKDTLFPATMDFIFQINHEPLIYLDLKGYRGRHYFIDPNAISPGPVDSTYQTARAKSAGSPVKQENLDKLTLQLQHEEVLLSDFGEKGKLMITEYQEGGDRFWQIRFLGQAEAANITVGPARADSLDEERRNVLGLYQELFVFADSNEVQDILFTLRTLEHGIAMRQASTEDPQAKAPVTARKVSVVEMGKTDTVGAGTKEAPLISCLAVAGINQDTGELALSHLGPLTASADIPAAFKKNDSWDYFFSGPLWSAYVIGPKDPPRGTLTLASLTDYLRAKGVNVISSIEYVGPTSVVLEETGNMTLKALLSGQTKKAFQLTRAVTAGTAASSVEEKVKSLLGGVTSTEATYSHSLGVDKVVDILRVLELLESQDEAIRREIAWQIASVRPAEHAEAMQDAIINQYTDKALYNGNQRLLLYISHDGKILGRMQMFIGTKGKLNDLAVSEDAKGTGIGSTLLGVFIKKLNDENVPQATIEAEKGATGFYRQYFEKLGIKTDFIEGGEGGLDRFEIPNMKIAAFAVLEAEIKALSGFAGKMGKFEELKVLGKSIANKNTLEALTQYADADLLLKYAFLLQLMKNNMPVPEESATDASQRKKKEYERACNIYMDYMHTMRVVGVAVALAMQLKVIVPSLDIDVVETAALLHDIAKKPGMQGLLNHHLDAAEAVREIAGALGKSKDFIEKILAAIKEHMGPLGTDEKPSFMLKVMKDAGSVNTVSDVPQPNSAEAILLKIADMVDLATGGFVKVVKNRQTDAFFFRNGQPEPIQDSVMSALNSVGESIDEMEGLKRKLFAMGGNEEIAAIIDKIIGKIIENKRYLATYGWEEVKDLEGFFSDFGNRPDSLLSDITNIIGQSAGSPATVDQSNPKIPDQISSPAITNSKPLGGIDMRAIPMVTQPMGKTGLPISGPRLPNLSFDLDEEWRQIQSMIEAGIIPSNERIKDYLQVCCAKEEGNSQTEKVLSCIADILRLEEEQLKPTEAPLRELLALLESNKPGKDMQVALARISVMEKEPGFIDQE